MRRTAVPNYGDRPGRQGACMVTRLDPDAKPTVPGTADGS